MDNPTLKRLYAAFLNFKGIGFVSFQYRDKNGEVSKCMLNIGASYENARQRDLRTLDAGVKHIGSPQYRLADWNDALAEIRSELLKQEIYIRDKNLSPCLHLQRTNNNLQFSHKTHDLYLFGKIHRNSVLREARLGRPLTNPVSIAKRTIQEEYLKTSRFKLFLLKSMRGTVKVNKAVVEV